MASWRERLGLGFCCMCRRYLYRRTAYFLLSLFVFMLLIPFANDINTTMPKNSRIADWVDSSLGSSKKNVDWRGSDLSASWTIFRNGSSNYMFTDVHVIPKVPDIEKEGEANEQDQLTGCDSPEMQIHMEPEKLEVANKKVNPEKASDHFENIESLKCLNSSYGPVWRQQKSTEMQFQCIFADSSFVR